MSGPRTDNTAFLDAFCAAKNAKRMGAFAVHGTHDGTVYLHGETVRPFTRARVQWTHDGDLHASPVTASRESHPKQRAPWVTVAITLAALRGIGFPVIDRCCSEGSRAGARRQQRDVIHGDVERLQLHQRRDLGHGELADPVLLHPHLAQVGEEPEGRQYTVGGPTL